MSEENDQITKNNHIVDIWNDIDREVHDIQKEGNLNNIADRAAAIIRVLRQGIERLRCVVGESDTDEPPRSLTDMNKLHKDELAFVLKYFWDWCKDGSGDCPAFTCRDFPCRYRQHTKMDCEENLKNGDLDEAGFKDQQEHGFYAEYCDDDGECCWAEYYLWCYRNGYDPQTGKKSK